VGSNSLSSGVIYLFRTPWSMNDEQLPGLMAQLEAVETEVSGPSKGNE
jgi:hypothetical protein